MLPFGPLNHEDSVLYFPPESFGPFRVLHQIGAGALGPVFRAYEPGDKNRDRLVAVKVFRLTLTPEQAELLVKEMNAVAVAGINHQNIAAPIGAGLEHGVPYLAQEYAIGDPLDVVLRERAPMATDTAVSLVEKLAAAIDHASKRSVHHRSLHLRDIMVSADGVRVTGFGIADALAKIGVKSTDRSDISALSAIAFEMVTGRRVAPETLKEFGLQHGVEARRVFEVALGAEPGARVEQASDFAAALTNALAPASAREEESSSAGAPLAPDPDPLNRYIDLDATDNFRRDLPEPAFSASAAQAPVFLNSDRQQGSRRPIVAALIAVGLLTVFSIAYFLKSPAPVAVPQSEAGVNETTVDLPAGSSGAPTLPNELPPRLPAPAPSRAASGAVLQRPARGSLLVRSTPAEAEVLLNGRASGKTPVALRDLAFGSYTIRVARQGYASDERTLQITAARPSASTTFSLRPSNDARTGPAGHTGALNVQSRPAGARVFVNERLAGATPIAVSDVPIGSATVRIELDGYRPWITTVRIGGGERTRVAASLERN